jgi:hypothetical protein
LIIDLNNIHGFNTLKNILWILSKKIANVFSWHILPCLCPKVDPNENAKDVHDPTLF